MLRPALLLSATIVSSAIGGAQQPAATTSPVAELARIVRIDDPTARGEAAIALARTKATDIDGWLRAMRSFGEFEPIESGARHFTVELWNGTGLETTEIHAFVSSRYQPGTPAPLLLAAHGTGGSGRGLPGMWRQVAEELGMIVIAPSESGPNEGYAFTPRERWITRSAIRWARLAFDIDENRVLLTGISRGGHLNWDIALRHPDLAAAIAPMIGGPRWNPGNAQNNLRYLENIKHLPIRDLQGERDDPGLLFNLRLAFERLDGLGATDAKLLTFPQLGHSFEFDAVDWVALFGKSRRDPIPRDVVRIAATPGEGRAFWVEVLGTDPRKVKESFRPKVSMKLWNSLDEDGRRRHVAGLVDKASARVAVRMDEPGQFEATSKLVKRFRILLTDTMVSARGKVTVRHNGRVKKWTARRSARVLLREFAARFDRTFLPTVEVDVR